VNLFPAVPLVSLRPPKGGSLVNARSSPDHLGAVRTFKFGYMF